MRVLDAIENHQQRNTRCALDEFVDAVLLGVFDVRHDTLVNATTRLPREHVRPNPLDRHMLLTGKKLSAQLIREAARAARDESRPISDVRASAEYRRILVETQVERAIVQAAARALTGGQAS